mmetsp:Transcript_20419/g.44622  ORF Transcript_20419/g.44622 Transcript_20419/m.44622 type:complete len:103 (+) Transcript_20419:1012-1320(+)
MLLWDVAACRDLLLRGAQPSSVQPMAICRALEEGRREAVGVLVSSPQAATHPVDLQAALDSAMYWASITAIVRMRCMVGAAMRLWCCPVVYCMVIACELPAL